MVKGLSITAAVIIFILITAVVLWFAATFWTLIMLTALEIWSGQTPTILKWLT